MVTTRYLLGSKIDKPAGQGRVILVRRGGETGERDPAQGTNKSEWRRRGRSAYMKSGIGHERELDAILDLGIR
jgi:hypothetical protein